MRWKASARRYLRSLERIGIAEFAEEGLQGTAQRSLDLRYRGQGYELNVPYHPHSPTAALDAFHRAHQQRYGFSDLQRPVDIVNLRLRMVAAAEPYVPASAQPIPGDGRAACYAERDIYFDGQFIPSRLYRRECTVPGDAIQGPAMITEYTSATHCRPAARAEVDGFGNLVIDVAEEPA